MEDQPATYNENGDVATHAEPQTQTEQSQSSQSTAGSPPESPRMKILRLLEEGKINAQEAAELLSALREPPQPERGGPWGRPGPNFRWGGPGPFGGPRGWGGPRWSVPGGDARFVRVRVTDQHTGEQRANINVPIGVVGMGMGWARWLGGRHRGQMDQIMQAIREGRRGTIFNATGDHGEQVEISIE